MLCVKVYDNFRPISLTGALLHSLSGISYFYRVKWRVYPSIFGCVLFFLILSFHTMCEYEWEI